MAGSCSTDLRGRVLAAEAGATPEAAARRFAVERVGGGPGSGIAGEVGAVLLGPLGEANHLTPAECLNALLYLWPRSCRPRRTRSRPCRPHRSPSSSACRR